MKGELSWCSNRYCELDQYFFPFSPFAALFIIGKKRIGIEYEKKNEMFSALSRIKKKFFEMLLAFTAFLFNQKRE